MWRVINIVIGWLCWTKSILMKSREGAGILKERQHPVADASHSLCSLSLAALPLEAAWDGFVNISHVWYLRSESGEGPTWSGAVKQGWWQHTLEESFTINHSRTIGNVKKKNQKNKSKWNLEGDLTNVLSRSIQDSRVSSLPAEPVC